MIKKDLGEADSMHHLIYLNDNKNAIIFPVNDKNDYIIWSRFKNAGYYYDKNTYPHKFVRISLRNPEYIRPIDDDSGMMLTRNELNMFINFLNSEYEYINWKSKSGWNFILDYIKEETYNKLDIEQPDYNKLETED